MHLVMHTKESWWVYDDKRSVVESFAVYSLLNAPLSPPFLPCLLSFFSLTLSSTLLTLFSLPFSLCSLSLSLSPPPISLPHLLSSLLSLFTFTLSFSDLTTSPFLSPLLSFFTPLSSPLLLLLFLPPLSLVLFSGGSECNSWLIWFFRRKFSGLWNPNIFFPSMESFCSSRNMSYLESQRASATQQFVLEISLSFGIIYSWSFGQ